MIASDFSAAELQACISHALTTVDNELPTLSREPLQLSAQQHELLLRYFLTPIKTEEFFQFHHEDGLHAHSLHALVADIFKNPGSLASHSRVIAEQFLQRDASQRQTQAYLSIAYISDLVLIDEVFDAVGIFLSETPSDFLQLKANDPNVVLSTAEGFRLDTLDRACLIFNNEEDEGFRALVVDRSKKADELRWWKDDFLGLQALSDGYHQTRAFMTAAKDFITKHLPEEQEVSKADTIALLNRSVEYFQKNDRCEAKDFAMEVFRDADTAKSFTSYAHTKAEERGQQAPDNFEISAPAVKKQQRIFKSVLKLDKNFHIYIHGNQEMIEKGVERDGRKFYKIYYKDES